MNLYYAMGGGLGHLTRAKAVMNTLGISDDSIILTSSRFARDRRVIGETPVILANKLFEKDIGAFRELISQIIKSSAIKTVYLDTFPLGILGEFCDFDLDGIEVKYVARLLNWESNSCFIKGTVPRFETTYLLEELDPAHREFIGEQSRDISDLEIVYPMQRTTADDRGILRSIIEDHPNFWVITHSGTIEELRQLIEFARDMREIESADVELILISPTGIEMTGILQFDLYPAFFLFEAARRIITGCGFNSMNQAKKFTERHYFIPFERRWDDQFARAKLYRPQ